MTDPNGVNFDAAAAVAADTAAAAAAQDVAVDPATPGSSVNAPTGPTWAEYQAYLAWAAQSAAAPAPAPVSVAGQIDAGTIPAPVQTAPVSSISVTSAPVALSADAQALVDAGAAPVVSDLVSMQAQIDKLSKIIAAQQDALKPSGDPVVDAVTNIAAHINARAAQSPSFDWTDIKAAFDKVGKIVTSGGKLAEKDVTLLKLAVEDFVPHAARLESTILPVLVNGLHKAVLEAL